MISQKVEKEISTARNQVVLQEMENNLFDVFHITYNAAKRESPYANLQYTQKGLCQYHPASFLDTLSVNNGDLLPQTENFKVDVTKCMVIIKYVVP